MAVVLKHGSLIESIVALEVLQLAEAAWRLLCLMLPERERDFSSEDIFFIAFASFTFFTQTARRNAQLCFIQTLRQVLFQKASPHFQTHLYVGYLSHA